MPYEFIPDIVRYRDSETGRFVPRSRVLSYANRAVAAGQDAADALANMVATRQISPADWEQMMRAEIKSTFLQEAMLGRGGRESMSSSDWGTVGRQLREQYDFLRGFREDIEADMLTEGQIRARSHLYFLASKTAFERAQGAAWGIQLPGFPGEKALICYTGCKCYWYIRRRDENTVLASWTRTAAESCASCVQRALDWAELVYIDGVLQNSQAAPPPQVLFSKQPARDIYQRRQVAVGDVHHLMREAAVTS